MDFQQDVLDRSNTIPVLVDFWAEWCGPCRVLGPVLDELAKEFEGRMELVKLNTEEHPQAAQEYQVMSIPNVKLFHRGEVVGEFTGALPKGVVTQWLEENLPSDEEPALQEILDQRSPWPSSTMAKQLEDFLEKSPENREAHLLLAKEVVLTEPERAVLLTHEIPAVKGVLETKEDIRALAELMTLKNEDGTVSELLSEVRARLQSNDLEGAVKGIVEVSIQDKSYGDDLPRRAGVALFRMLGIAHPLTLEYRKLFDMALY